MAGSLRDQLTEAFDQHVEETAPQVPATSGTEEVVATTTPEAPAVAATTETAEAKAGRTAGRSRDAQGRLLPGKPQKDSAAQPETAAQPKDAAAQITATAAAVPTPAPRRPSGWKKELWPIWDKLAAGQPLTPEERAAYVKFDDQRAADYSHGVSTYKAEADRLKPIDEAMRELEPTFRQYNIQPEKWLRDVGQAHRTLAQGSPEQKLGMLVKLAQDYQIPLQNLFVRGNDGQVYFNPQAQAYQPQQQAAPQPNLEQLVDQALSKRQIAQTIAQFESEAPEKYPHYQVLKPTMVGLLQAELATDLSDAYQQALKHPRHSDLYADIQEQEAQAKAEQVAAEKAKQVQRARSQAVSPKGSTPTAPAGQAAKGVRAALEKAFDEHAGGGRV